MRWLRIQLSVLSPDRQRVHSCLGVSCCRQNGRDLAGQQPPAKGLYSNMSSMQCQVPKCAHCGFSPVQEVYQDYNYKGRHVGLSGGNWNVPSDLNDQSSSVSIMC